MTRSSEPRWYLIHCKPYEHVRALENLERQGFECYCPMRQVERQREGRKYIGTEPPFPRYLFIHLDRLNDKWYRVRSTRGVHRIVRFNEFPTPVSDQIIDGIRARLTGPVSPEPYLKPGERVLIAEGAFSHLEAIFVANDGNERVKLLMTILHCEQTLSFPAASVRRLRDRIGA